MDASNLYILIFPKVGCIKIGKADDVAKRIRQLESNFGTPDYSESYIYSDKLHRIFEIESALHKLLSPFSFKHARCDGYTELFTVDAISHALSLLDLVSNTVVSKGVNAQYIYDANSNYTQAKSHKGIERPNDWFCTERYEASKENLMSTYNLIKSFVDNQRCSIEVVNVCEGIELKLSGEFNTSSTYVDDFTSSVISGSIVTYRTRTVRFKSRTIIHKAQLSMNSVIFYIDRTRSDEEYPQFMTVLVNGFINSIKEMCSINN